MDPFFLELNAEEEHEKILGNLKCLATIQKREALPMFPGIAEWVASLLPPVYERYHDRCLRDEIKKKVEKLAKIGDLSKMAAIFDNAELRHRYFNDFNKAMKEYAELRQEV